jgi:hypothetical protein
MVFKPLLEPESEGLKTQYKGSGSTHNVREHSVTRHEICDFVETNIITAIP